MRYDVADAVIAAETWSASRINKEAQGLALSSTAALAEDSAGEHGAASRLICADVMLWALDEMAKKLCVAHVL